MMQALGHDGPPANYWRENLVTGLPLERCPRMTERLAAGSAAEREVAEVRRTYWPHYKRGFLPAAGGIDDQPALVMDVLVALEATERAVRARFDALQAEDDDAGGADDAPGSMF